MNLTQVFMNGCTQFVRIPEEYEIESDEVYIGKISNAIILIPKKHFAKVLNFSSLEKTLIDIVADGRVNLEKMALETEKDDDSDE